MFYFILFLISLTIVTIFLDKIVRANPRGSFFIFRFSGTISIIFIAIFVLNLTDGDKSPGTIYLFFSTPFMLLHQAKSTAKVLNTPANGIFKKLRKLITIVSSTIVFPMGMLAKACHNWFFVEKIQEKQI